MRQLPRDPFRRVPLAASPLIRALREAGVRWVLDGSAVLMTAGSDITPGDLDVVPDLDDGNLERLSGVLEHLDAFPEPNPDWEHGLTLDEVRRWSPRPAQEANLDHAFNTAHGILDIVPRLSGTYRDLEPVTRRGMIEGEEVRAVPVERVLERLRRSGRAKDRKRLVRVVDLG